MEKTYARQLIKLAELCLVAVGFPAFVISDVRVLRACVVRYWRLFLLCLLLSSRRAFSTPDNFCSGVAPPYLCHPYPDAVPDVCACDKYHQPLNSGNAAVATLAHGLDLDLILFSYSYWRWPERPRPAEPSSASSTSSSKTSSVTSSTAAAVGVASFSITRAIFQIGSLRIIKEGQYFNFDIASWYPSQIFNMGGRARNAIRRRRPLYLTTAV